jgi:GntR family transcriptional regulator
VRGPRYASIANSLRDRIRRGDYRSGSALPSQKELAALFGTTVMTVRQALSLLQVEGLLKASHGVGTFVSSGVEKGRDLRLRGLPDAMRGAREKIITRIVERDLDVAEPRVCAMFGSRTRKCCSLTRLRLVWNEPVIFQRSYLPTRFVAIVRSLTDSDSLYARLNGVCGGVVEGREIVLPASLSRKEASLLGDHPGMPALLSLRISFDLSHAPVLYDEAWIRGGRAFLSIRQTGGTNVSSYSIPSVPPQDPSAYLFAASFWEEES